MGLRRGGGASRRQRSDRHPLRDILVEARYVLVWRADGVDPRDGRTAAIRNTRGCARRGRLYDEPATRGAWRARRAARLRIRRLAAGPGARLPVASDRAATVLLEERQMAAWPGVPARRPPRLLGAPRVFELRRSVEGGAL